VIAFVSEPATQEIWRANLGRLAPEATPVFLSTRPPENWPEHVHRWHRHQLNEQGLELPTLEPIRLVEHIDRSADPLDPPIRPGSVLIHPGSGGRAKCWPAERFAQLAEHLQQRGRPVVVTLGEAELERWPEAQRTSWARRFDVRPLEHLQQLRQLLNHAVGYVGNDSGPTHLAAALGLPTVALFGPTNPVHWAPLGVNVRVLAPPTPRAMDWLSVAAAQEAVREAGLA
jgi:ADP-heptose:LPS heptosyltransferase